MLNVKGGGIDGRNHLRGLASSPARFLRCAKVKVKGGIDDVVVFMGWLRRRLTVLRCSKGEVKGGIDDVVVFMGWLRRRLTVLRCSKGEGGIDGGNHVRGPASSLAHFSLCAKVKVKGGIDDGVAFIVWLRRRLTFCVARRARAASGGAVSVVWLRSRRSVSPCSTSTVKVKVKGGIGDGVAFVVLFVVGSVSCFGQGQGRHRRRSCVRGSVSSSALCLALVKVKGGIDDGVAFVVLFRRRLSVSPWSRSRAASTTELRSWFCFVVGLRSRVAQRYWRYPRAG